MPRKTIAFGFFISLFIALQFAATNISSCQVINAPGDYALVANLSNTTTCIQITANNTLLDCGNNTINGSSTSGTGIYIGSVNNVTVQNCVIFNESICISASGSAGISLFNITAYNSPSGSVAAIYLLVSNSTLSDITVYNSSNGIYLRSGSNNRVSNFMAYNNSYIALQTYPGSGSNISISNVTVYGGYEAMEIGTSNTTIYNATVFNSTFSGIRLTYGSNITMSNILSYRNGQYGIMMDSVSGSGLSNILTYNNSLYGIYYGGFTNSTTSNATTYGNGGYGIYGYSSSNLTFVNVTSSNNSRYGIYLSSSNRCNFTSLNLSNNNFSISIEVAFVHSFADSYTDGRPMYSAVDAGNSSIPPGAGFILVANSRNVTVQNQTLYGNAQALIIANSSSVYLSNITAYNNSLYGILVTNSSSGVSISGVTAYGNAYGISISGSSSNNSITNSTAYLNTGSGIYIASGPNNSVSNITAYNNLQDGILIYSPNNSVSSSILYNNAYGIQVSSANGNRLSGITAYNNSQTGIYIYGFSSGNNVSGSVSYGNAYGLRIYFGAGGNSVSNVVTYNNTQTGIDVSIFGSGNSLSNITSYGNLGSGLSVASMTGTSFVSINISGNSNYGILLDSSATGTSFTNTTACSNNKSGGAYYDFYDLDSATNNTNLACGTSSPEGRCNSSCPLANNPPVIFSSRISPSPDAGTNDTLQGFCNATDAEGENVTYYYAWYLNAVLNASGQTSDYTQGIEINIGNISPSSLAAGQNWTLECTANDGTANSSALNSSITSILDNAPAIRSSRISPSPNATTSDTLQGFCNATDADGDNISYYYTWYLNGAANRSGQSSSYAPGIEANVDNVSSPSLLAGQNWTLECKASDATLNSSALNSSATLINLPVLAQLAMKLRNHMLRPMFLSAVSLDGELITFDPPITFAPAEAKIITLDLTTPACAPPSFIATFNNVTFYYSEGLLANLTQSGSIPLVLRCR